jgi:serine/threonine-protein kinase
VTEDVFARLKSALADRYSIERELGAGGMATVYLAEDLKHHRKVAVKVLRPELAASLGVERFVREIEIAANLTHPHILPLHDSGEADGFLYYVMPFIEGESLRERLDREGKLDVRETIRLTDQVASALSHAHERGVVHRDIKPENILLAGDQAIVADFGIARAVEVAGGERLTGTGIAVGTPAYMSPEQAYGSEEVDARSDVYALGCVVYEMVACRAPFEGDTPQALLAKHAVDTAPSLRTSDPNVPLFLERAVDRALAKSPADRFQSASAFAEALTTEMVVARVGRRRWPWRAAATALIGLVLVVLWGFSRIMGGPAYDRLAVLPPVNLMNDPEQEYFVQGMHTALISELQRAGVVVIARTSVLQYENTQKPIREIAVELGVDALIEAYVFRAGDSVEFEVRLVDGNTAEYLADPIARSGELRNVMAMYRELTSAIAAEVQAALTPQAEARLANARSIDPDAYEAYLRGSQARLALTVGGLETAERYFNLALEIDPNYAAAWAGIARVWNARGQMGLTPQREAMENSREATLKALALDETEWEAHRALAGILTFGDWDWPAAEREWNRVLEDNPNNGEALATYSHFLMIMGRPDEAMVNIERALEFDPLNVKIQSFYVTVLVYARRYNDAIAAAREVLRLQPSQPVARNSLYQSLFLTGRYEEALSLDREEVAADPELQAALEAGNEEGGYAGAQQRLADVLAGRFGETGGPPAIVISDTYLFAGDYDRSLHWLERAYQDGDGNMPYLGHPLYDSVRSDRRFQDLLRRMDLPR